MTGPAETIAFRQMSPMEVSMYVSSFGIDSLPGGDLRRKLLAKLELFGTGRNSMAEEASDDAAWDREVRAVQKWERRRDIADEKKYRRSLDKKAGTKGNHDTGTI